tara:strand:+ start:1216 stop:1719 length:504 start_codon:yes stop_codon:yes gene_type:complete
MRIISLFFLTLITISCFALHKFYVSTTSIKYIPEDRSLQITAQVFTDDLEFTLQKITSGIKLNPDNKVEMVDSLIKKYFKKNLVFKFKDSILQFDYLGKIYRNDLLVAYLEILLDSTITNFNVKNTLLFDFTDDQKNILHFRSKGRRKSFLSVSSRHTFEVELNISD